jgi:predicted aspartyl protease
MKLSIINGLPFVSIGLVYHQQVVEIPLVLVDTGSVTTVVSSDWGQKIGIVPEIADTIRTLRGVGGSEVVFTRRLDSIQVGQKNLEQFETEFGAMEYGFQINGILGMDFLLKANASINLNDLSLNFA